MRESIRILILALLLSLTAGALAAESEEVDPLETGHQMLTLWQIDEAAELASKLIEAGDDSEAAAYFLGHYYFFIGDYLRALEQLNAAGSWNSDRRSKYDYEPYLRAAFENTREFLSKESEHFEVRYQGDKDRLLADAALETLERVYAVIGDDIGYRPKERIVVEFYPKLEMLAKATGVTLQALRTSGTIAICKFNRLMVSSPRVSPQGFGWLDTLNHEYVHLILCRASVNTIPVWLHEGLSKFHEERWRLPPGGQLDAGSESLLARALREDKLVTLEQIHPSMAYLPSQEHTALAFAEVLTMIQWMHQQRGAAGLRRLISDLPKQLGDLDKTFRQVYGFDVKGMETRWLRALKRRRLRELEYAFDDYSILFEKPSETNPEEDIRKIKTKKGRDFMTLGKLLKDRDHAAAAAVELNKAVKILGKDHLLLQNYLADVYLKLDRHKEAIASLEPIIELSSNYLPTRIRLARAYLESERFDDAIAQLKHAAGINPFDPRIYQMLEQAYTRTERKEMAEQARASLKILMSEGR